MIENSDAAVNEEFIVALAKVFSKLRLGIASKVACLCEQLAVAQ